MQGFEGNIFTPVSTQFPDPTRSPVPDEDPSKKVKESFIVGCTCPHRMAYVSVVD